MTFKRIRFVLCTMVLACLASAGARAAEFPFQDPALPVEQRVADLVSRLTLEEKASLMNEQAAAVPRLGIKKYRYWNEALHGVARSGKFTVFPQAIGMAATWDPALLFDVATAISDEAWGANNRDALTSGYPPERFLDFWSPVINMARDPRWGRTPESYGEDPVLTTQIALAFVAGLQGDDPKYLKTAATPKHFVANNQEASRLYGNSQVSEKMLREYYFPAFRATVVQGHAQSFMGAYNALNGIPCNANKWLLTDVLRGEWGFDGFVVTDCGAPSHMITQHLYARDGAEAAAYAVNAGVDIECGSENILPKYLAEAVERGLLTEEAIDRAITRLMINRMKVGMFDPPEMNPYTKISPDVIGSREHMLLARRVAAESIVLLKNDKVDGAPLLPVNPADVKTITVLGPYGDALEYGDYTGDPANPPVTLLQGLRARAGGAVDIKLVAWEPLDENAFKPVPAAGFSGAVTEAFFDNPKLDGAPAVSRAADKVALTSSTLPEGFGGAPYAVRWTGSIRAGFSGAHVFNVDARGTVRLTLDGNTLEFTVEKPREPAKPKSGAVLREAELRQAPPDFHVVMAFLEKGRDYSFTLEYVPSGRNPLLKLEWDAPDAAGAARRTAAYEAVRDSDLVIAAMGYSQKDEHEGMDRDDLGLPTGQAEYARAVVLQNPRTVVALTNGSPLAVNWLAANAPALVEWWLPGEQGGQAFAEMLFGDTSPSGRLPFTVYKSMDDLPPFDDYDITKGRTYMYFQGEPLYPFGHGLSYTTFDYVDLDADVAGTGDAATVNVSFSVVNAGPRDGAEVAQVYVRRVGAPADRPLKKLHGFQRVTVEKEKDKYVTISFPVADLAYWDTDKKAFVVAPGDYEIMAGASSADIRLTKTISIGK